MLIERKREAQKTPQRSPPALQGRKRGPGAYKSSLGSRNSIIPAANPCTRPLTSLTKSNKRRENMTGNMFDLNNISNSETRKDVAELMAVAPGLPILDLHDMLVSLGGNFAAAKRQAMRANRVPSTHPSVKPEPTSIRGPSTQNLGPASHYGDEVMVKIDPNENFLTWASTYQTLDTYVTLANIKQQDSDAPPEPQICRKPPGFKRSKPRSGKSHASKTKSNISVHRTDPSARETSFAKSFVVPDNVIELDSDTSDSTWSSNDSNI
jgi:hypothetical protein